MLEPVCLPYTRQYETDLLGENIGTVLNITEDLQTVLKGKTAASELNITINGESLGQLVIRFHQ